MKDEPSDSQYLSQLASRAEAGDSAAAFELGEIYREGEQVAQDWKAAFLWYHLGATQGDPEAQNNLGTMYLSGLGCEADPTLATHWYRQSARQGNAVAQFNLGKRFQVGDGVDLDLTEAIHWFSLAAEQGNTDATCDLGTMMRFGHGGTRDLVSAAALHIAAAQAGDPVAVGNLSDYREELQDLALSGNAAAAMRLSQIHNLGLGVEKSMPLTWAWIRWARECCQPCDDEDLAAEIASAYGFYRNSLDADDRKHGDRVVRALRNTVSLTG